MCVNRATPLSLDVVKKSFPASWLVPAYRPSDSFYNVTFASIYHWRLNAPLMYRHLIRTCSNVYVSGVRFYEDGTVTIRFRYRLRPADCLVSIEDYCAYST